MLIPRELAETEISNLERDLATAEKAENDARTAYIDAYLRTWDLVGELRRTRERLATRTYEI